MREKFNYFFLVIMVFFLFLPMVSALQISPAILDLEYTPDEKQVFSVTIINDISQDIVIELSFESFEGKINYKDYFVVKDHPTNKIPISAGASETIEIEMSYPPIEKFGDVRFAMIRFYQVLFEATSDVSATVAIKVPIDTNVPYPEKYVKVEMQDFGTVVPNSQVELEASLTNLGLNVIEQLDGSFVLSQGETKKTVPFSESFSLFLQEESNIVVGTLDTTGMEAGRYYVEALLNYDGETKVSAPVSLVIGEKSVEIIDVNPDNLKAGSTNSLNVRLLNLWIEDINSAVSIDLVSSDGSVVKSADFGTYTLPVSVEKDISGGIDLTSVGEGDYVIRVKAVFDGEEVSNNFAVKVEENNVMSSAPESESSMLVYVLVVVVILIVVSVIVFIWYRKRRQEGNNQSGVQQ